MQMLLKGMFRLKPSLPRYTLTYDVKYILNYIKTNIASREITLERIWNILVTLMCLLNDRRS